MLSSIGGALEVDLLDDFCKQLQDRNLCQDLCFLQLLIKIDKSKILHCKKAWSNNDMSLLQYVKKTIN